MSRLSVALTLAVCMAGSAARAQDGGATIHRLGGVEPPDPRELAADPEAFEELLAEQGLLLDLQGGTISARGGTLHDSETLGYPIEYLMVTDRGKTHESLFVVKAQPSVLNACIQALGLQPGHPMRWVRRDPQPTREAQEAGDESAWEAIAGSGPLIAVDVVWTDDDGLPHQQSLESMLLDVRTGEPLPELDWIYTGSGVAPLRQGRQIVQAFMADLQGNVIAIYLTGMGAALLERNSIEGTDDTLYTINPEAAPKRGTPVTIVFRNTGRTAAPGPPPAGEVIVRGEEGERLDEWLTRAVPWGFHGVVLVARGNDILLHKGYGFADRERGVPMSTRTVFPLGDMSGYFVKTAILQLANEGKLGLSNPIVRHLDHVPEAMASVTIENLAQGRAGLASDLPDQARFVALDPAVAAILAQPRRSNLDIARWSHLNLTLLIAIVESASGLSWGDYLAEHIFGPAEMTDSGLEGASRWAGSQLAYGERLGSRVGTPVDRTLSWPSKGGLVSSVRDLFRWERAIAQGVLSANDDSGFVFGERRDPPIRLPVVMGVANHRSTSISSGLLGLQVQDTLIHDEDATIILATGGWGEVVSDSLKEILLGGQVDPLPAIVSPDAEAIAALAEHYTGITPEGLRFTVVAAEDGVLLLPQDKASRLRLWGYQGRWHGGHPRLTLPSGVETDALSFRPQTDRNYVCWIPSKEIMRTVHFWDHEDTGVSGFTVFGKNGREILSCRKVDEDAR